MRHLQLTSPYWLAHKGRFPILSHLARIVFVVLAASLKSECVFSAENTVTQNRASLNSEKVEECVIFRYKLMGGRSLHLFHVMYLKKKSLGRVGYRDPVRACQ